jgi:truncated hemoglobin YjbI
VPDEVVLYEAVGGMAFFESLVDRFYQRVAGDPELLRLYPHSDDLGPARRRLTLFLAASRSPTAHRRSIPQTRDLTEISAGESGSRDAVHATGTYDHRSDSTT